MPWYNFIDPIFLHKSRKINIELFGVVERYTFSNIVGSIMKIRINISENVTKSFCIKLRKRNYSNIESFDNEFYNTLNRDSNDDWKTYDTNNYLTELLKEKQVCIKNLELDKDKHLIGDIYIDNILINILVSPGNKKQKKKVTFNNIDDSIVSVYSLIKENIINLF
jgi:hypothetical protein